MSKKLTLLRPAGYAVITGENGIIEYDTQQCCHCGRHFPINKHAGTTCSKCMKDTCGSPECDFCLTIEQRLELFEKGLLKELK